MIALLAAGLLVFAAVAVFWQLRAIRRTEVDRAGIAEAFDRKDVDAMWAADERPASETRPGTDFAEQDALELLYSLPDYDELAAGRDRLWKAIHDDEAKGEQQ